MTPGWLWRDDEAGCDWDVEAGLEIAEMAAAMAAATLGAEATTEAMTGELSATTRAWFTVAVMAGSERAAASTGGSMVASKLPVTINALTTAEVSPLVMASATAGVARMVRAIDG